MTHEKLEKLLAGQELSPPEISSIFAAMLNGSLPEAQIAGFLVSWRFRGEKTAELTIGAQALRANATKISLPASLRPLLDNCGTGGDGAHSFNISTAAAIVAATAGVRVAKHGNRSISSKCGSADLLFAAGFPADLSAAATTELLEKTGMTFFFAPNFHPMLRHVGPVRKALGIRTIFNLLGPLANPIAPDYQILGVGSKDYLQPMAEALRALGCQKALVVHSRDGLDELSPAAPTDAILVDGAILIPYLIDPFALGISASLTDIAGGDPTYNLNMLNQFLLGRSSSVAQAVALNAGAALWLYGCCKTLAEGVALALAKIDSGDAKTFFDRFIATAKTLAGTRS